MKTTKEKLIDLAIILCFTAGGIILIYNTIIYFS